MNLRLLKFSLWVPLFIACQAGSEIIRPDIDAEGDEGFTCTLSAEKIEYDHAYDYDPFSLEVSVGEEAAVVDLSGAPWLEVEDNVDLLYPDSHVALNIVPKEPNYGLQARSGVVVLRGKYTGESVEIPVSQAGSSQENADSEANTWSLTPELVSSDDWLISKVMVANQDDGNGILSLEHSINSPVEVVEDEGLGTFKGMQVGDAILMRIPVKKMEPGVSVSAMLDLFQKTSGVRTEWVAEYWEDGQWNSTGTFTTTKETADATHKACTCEFTLAEPIVNDYIKVRFRKLSGEGVVTYFIPAAPLTGAQMKLTEPPKEPIHITVDFATDQPFTEDIASNESKNANPKTYTLKGDEGYQFTINTLNGYKRLEANSTMCLRLVIEKNGTRAGYIKLPAIEGYSLSRVEITGNSTDNKTFYIIPPEVEDPFTITATDQFALYPAIKVKAPTGGVNTKSVDLTSDKVGQSYYIYAVGKNAQISKFVLTYE